MGDPSGTSSIAGDGHQRFALVEPSGWTPRLRRSVTGWRKITLRGICSPPVKSRWGQEAELLDVGNEVRADDAVDFVNLDALKLAGKEGRGKIAEIAIWRGRTDRGKFTAYPCRDSGGIDWVEMQFGNDFSDAVLTIPTDSHTVGCVVTRFKVLGKTSMGNIKGELLKIVGLIAD